MAMGEVSDGPVRGSTQEFNSGVTAQRETHFKSEYLLSQLYYLSLRFCMIIHEYQVRF